MPSSVPTPVAAALGLVPTVLDGVRRLPGQAVMLPVHMISHALTTLGSARREYDALAERGERLLSRLRGTSFDEVEDVVEDSLQGTPFAKPYDVVEDALEDAGETVTQLVRSGTTRARRATGTATRSVGKGLDRAADTVEDVADRAADTVEDVAGTTAGTVEDVADTAVDTVRDVADAVAETAQQAAGAAVDTAERTASGVAETVQKTAERTSPDTAEQDGAAPDTTPEDEAPKGAPTPKATEPDSTRIGTAASTEVVDAVERVSAAVGGEVLDHDDLPLPDYDHLTLGSLRGRMRSLDLPQLIQVRDYEKAHADRLPIVTMLDNRIAKLANDPTAPLSGSSPTDAVPAKSRAAKRASKVSPKTSGPVRGTAPHGVPGNNQDPR